MRKFLCWKHVLLLAVLAGAASFVVRSGYRPAWATQAADSDEPELKVDPFPIPEGDAEKLFEFLEELSEVEQKFASAEEEREYQVKLMLTMVEVADRVLKQEKLTDDEAEKAAFFKVQGLINMAQLGIPGGAKRAIAAVNAMTKDPRAMIAKFAKNNQQQVRIICVGGLSPEDRDALVTDILAEVQKRKFAPRTMKLAQMLGESLGEAGDQDRVADYYGKLAASMRESGSENLIEQAKRIEGQLRRMKLPGNEMELTGTTLAGDKFDWESYRGKVVLVDFWATWCGPCRAELPNVKKNYKKYHDKGFEVVGISLDEDPAKLETFLIDQKIPWVTLFEPDEKSRGWETPLAVHYGVSGIPMAILVGKDGKVVSMSARGPELSALLEDLLGGEK